jgi:hypothetical protein
VLADGDLRREVFCFPSGGDSLYGSLYSGADPDLGLVVCPSWGWEMGDTLDACHRLARGLALMGGASLVLHWPGYGDSTGDSTAAATGTMEDAARNALVELRDRASPARLGVAGIRLGASVAAMLAPPADALLLLQPVLDPDRFVEALRRLSRTAAGERHTADWAFGHPVPEAVPTTVDVTGSLNRFRGRGALFAYEGGDGDLASIGLERVPVNGNWRRHDGHAGLADAGLVWLRRHGANT